MTVQWCPRCNQLQTATLGMFENHCSCCGHPLPIPIETVDEPEDEGLDNEMEVF
jgi:hypothetical protein